MFKVSPFCYPVELIPCRLTLRVLQEQSYRLHLFELIYTRSSGKLHFIFTPVDPISTPSKALLINFQIVQLTIRIVQVLATNMSQHHSFYSPSVYGGVAGYRPQVQNVSTLLQRLLCYLTVFTSDCTYLIPIPLSDVIIMTHPSES